ncbi:PAAR-like protein [Streptobacillus canis]|uniref:PAAR-like protein n=1 Tax=Streptobacillus canis TaxID=2678686 RepID=UPI0012E1C071|nr:PAAR-like protein [Streptobacillus canis]
MQNELIIMELMDIAEEINPILQEFNDQEIYVDEKIKYFYNHSEIDFKNIKSKNSNFINLIDYRGKNLKINIAGILATAFIFGIKSTKDFLKEKNGIYLDHNMIPITEYYKNFEIIDIANIFIKKIEEVVVPIENKEDEEFIEKIPENDKKDFFGQDSKTSLSSVIDALKNPEILKVILELIKNKKNNTLDVKKLNDTFKDSELIKIKDFETEKFVDKTTKKMVKQNNDVNRLLKEKYESKEYNQKPSHYIEKTTNRDTLEDDNEDIDTILNNYEKNSKDNSGIGDVIRQRGYDDFRDISKKDKKLNIEDMIYLILKNNKGEEELRKLENCLGEYSCRYINENLLNKIKSFTKNLFLSKVSELINRNLKYTGIDYQIDLTEYDYLKFGKKDIDDVKIRGDKRILDFLKINNLVKKSFEVDSKGVRIYPRSRRIFDNILIEYIKKRLNFKKENFDGIDIKDANHCRNILILLDELTNGLAEDDYSRLDEIGSELNITKMIIALLKNKFRYSNKLLELLNSSIDKNYDEYTKDSTRSIDKSSILNIFPTSISLEKHCEIKKIRGIYFFYKSFYEDEKNKILKSETIATTSVLVKCSMCPTPSRFITGSVNTFVKGDMVLTENDKLITPFATCALSKICSINILTSNWNNVSNITYLNARALLISSNINCSVGGLITLESTINKNVLKSEIKVSNIQSDNKTKKISPFRTKFELKEFLNDRIISFKKINEFYLMKENSMKFIKNLEIFMRESEKILASFLKLKYFEDKIDYKYAIYDDLKIIDISDVSEVVKEYYYCFINRKNNNKGTKIYEKYGKNINAHDFVEEYLKDCNFINSDYEVDEGRNLNEPIWIRYLLKEYNRYKNRKRNMTLNEEFKRKIVEYHKIGGGIDANSQKPWCASFANWILHISGIGSYKTPSSQEMIKKLNRIDKSLYGSIVIYTKYDENNNSTGHGHITFILGITDDKKQYICLGGNQDREIKFSKYYVNKKMGVKGGYFKINGIFWPPGYPVEGIQEIK